MITQHETRILELVGPRGLVTCKDTVAEIVWGPNEMNPFGGALQVRQRQLDFSIEAPLSPSSFWEMRSQMSGTLREKLMSSLSGTS